MQTEDGSAKEAPLEYDDRLMQRAFDQARKALGEGEVPIGCVFSVDGAVVAEVMLILQNASKRARVDSSTLNSRLEHTLGAERGEQEEEPDRARGDRLH